MRAGAPRTGTWYKTDTGIDDRMIRRRDLLSSVGTWAAWNSIYSLGAPLGALAAGTSAFPRNIADGGKLLAQASGSSGALPSFRPEQFGAKGDGSSDDTAAFQALGKAVTANGGGRIILRQGAIYRLGQQEFKGALGKGTAWRSKDMLSIENCSGLVIEGNGATLRVNDGQRYGAFDRAKGTAYNAPPGKFTDWAYAAVVGSIIRIFNCKNVRLSDFTVDGNQDKLLVGGRWGDAGIQLRAVGLHLEEVADLAITNVRSNNNGLDGFYLKGRNVSKSGGVSDNINFDGVTAERNGRQGLSIVGGRGIVLRGCNFSLTGQGRISSSPAAGVDIEPNNNDWVRDVEFHNCRFEANKGNGIIADHSRARNLTVDNCEFWGGFTIESGGSLSSGDCIWLKAEHVVIRNCRVHGCITQLPPTASLVDTVFDDSAHEHYGPSAQNRIYLVQNARCSFLRCSFNVFGTRRLVHGLSGSYFKDCNLRFEGVRPDKDALAVFASGSTIDGMKVAEKISARPASGYYISARKASVRGRIQVAGPYIKWS